MVNRETLSKDQEKKWFLQFVEDYNTGEYRLVLCHKYPGNFYLVLPATLHHEKYYVSAVPFA